MSTKKAKVAQLAKTTILFTLILTMSIIVVGISEENVTVPQDAINPKYFSQLSATQLAQSKVTVPKSWVKESYFEKKKKEDSQVDDFSNVNWRWGLEKINAPQAWEYTQGEGIVVAVIDGGIDFDHHALQGKAWTNPDEVSGNGKDDDFNDYKDDMHGWDFIDWDSSSVEGSRINEHGTEMAILATNVAPKVRIMDLRVAKADESLASWKGFRRAFVYALEKGADIISFSINFDYNTSLFYYFKKAVEKTAKEVLIFGASGNASSGVQPPATMEEILAVAAVDRRNNLYERSNTGPDIFLAGPGEGTSFAVPHVAGVAALVLSINPELKPNEVIDILASTATDLGPPGRDEKFGYGLVDAEAAVKKALEMKKES